MKIRRILFISALMMVFISQTVVIQAQKHNLINQDWRWQSAEINGQTITPWPQEGPEHSGLFHVFFNPNGSIYCSTDCNDFSAKYLISGQLLKLTEFGGTKMECMDSQQDLFIGYLKQAASYKIGKDDRLTIYLEGNSGTMLFSPAIICKSGKN